MLPGPRDHLSGVTAWNLETMCCSSKMPLRREDTTKFRLDLNSGPIGNAYSRVKYVGDTTWSQSSQSEDAIRIVGRLKLTLSR